MFTDPPQVILQLGNKLNPDTIKENDDVYFECNIRANPKKYKITWLHNVSIPEKCFVMWESNVKKWFVCSSTNTKHFFLKSSVNNAYNISYFLSWDIMEKHAQNAMLSAIQQVMWMVSSMLQNLRAIEPIIAEEWKTNFMSFAILFYFLCTQHVSDINISIIRSLRLCCWITTLVVLFMFRCVLEIWCGWVWVVSILQAEAQYKNQLYLTRNVVVLSFSHKIRFLNNLLACFFIMFI